MNEKLQSLAALIEGAAPLVAVLSNASAYLKETMEDVSWLGFYLTSSKEPDILYLGPFQGKPACIRIPFGKGVCGVSAKHKETVIVPDVGDFPGYISCDVGARSEIVVPMITRDGFVYGVLDLDSDSLDRFDQSDAVFLEEAVKIIMERIGRNRTAGI